ncbi:MAG: SDR family oxidoreductase [Pirellulales bacterium]|nr:SDR family oxidoreductase [Pirellulales bacterium]
MILTGKTAIVTGAGRGIGRAIASALAQAGADVAINYLTEPEDAEQTAAAVRAAGRKALLCQADVADYKAMSAAVERAVDEWGHLDIAVSNAAYSDRHPFFNADLSGFHRTLDVTMWGAFHLLHLVTRQMIHQGRGGCFVSISSPHAVLAIPTSMAYGMAKAAIDQMCRTAAIELTEHRIRVNTIHPGWTDTPGERKFASDEAIDKAGAKLPWGRLARPEEIARGVVFLCDPASDYITGSTLAIEGAITLPWWAKEGMEMQK